MARIFFNLGEDENEKGKQCRDNKSNKPSNYREHELRISALE